jgi:UDP-glucose 4-epimerase
VAIFAGRLLAGEAPLINGNGKQTRDYVYVTDVARSNLQALELDVDGVYNIGTGRETDVNSLASMMIRITGFEGQPDHGPPRPGEQLRSSVDPSLAGRTLGWKPEIALEEGLRRTIEHFRKRQKT